MQALVDCGAGVRVFPSDEPVLDLSNRSDIAAIEAAFAGARSRCERRGLLTASSKPA